MSLITFDMGGQVLWEWIAKGKGLAEGHCKTQRYQTRANITDVEVMRRKLSLHFRNLEIVELKRAEIERPQGGIVNYKSFTHGIIDEVNEELARKRIDSRVFFSRSLLNASPVKAAGAVGRSLLRRQAPAGIHLAS